MTINLDHLSAIVEGMTPGPWCPDLECTGHLECREIGYIGHLELHSPISPFVRASDQADYAGIVALRNAAAELIGMARKYQQAEALLRETMAYVPRLRGEGERLAHRVDDFLLGPI